MVLPVCVKVKAFYWEDANGNAPFTWYGENKTGASLVSTISAYVLKALHLQSLAEATGNR